MWEHTHLFNESKKGFTKMTDRIDCRIPLGLVGKIFSRKYVKNRIEQLLEYRHSTVYEAVSYTHLTLPTNREV